MCGLAQAVTIPFLVVMHIFTWLAPFFAYHYFTEDEGHQIRVALFSGLLAVGVYLAAEVLKFGVAIVGKRFLAGRIAAGRYPLWGVTYFRWWLGGMLGELAPVAMLSGTPLLVWYLRALGARIGKHVLIDSVQVQVPEVGDDGRWMQCWDSSQYRKCTRRTGRTGHRNGASPRKRGHRFVYRC